MATVTPSGAALGAEIRGIDASVPLADADLALVLQALHTHKVVVLRDQLLQPAQQIAFCARFGSLEEHVLAQFLVPGHRELVRVSNVLDAAGKPIGLVDAGRLWHSDGAFLDKPNLYSMLYAIEIPHGAGGRSLGETWFVDTAKAYESLPRAMKQRITGLTALNSLEAVYAAMHKDKAALNRPPLTEAQRRGVVHPVVRVHPHSGQLCLYVSRAATVRILGLADEDSRALIDELADWCVRDEMQYHHRWREGDLLIWDNCGGQHLAIGDYALPQRRLMHRATVAGIEPVGASAHESATADAA
ncbi:Alpha-ketoglutarate-dependent taurine dioxygenase [Variovorax sp. SRS16]|uniref:TauD/TfdA dioxygenase family protein n=1 Tax=Variovorax sp. SRS16 TaxID=282217 RepID=UPI001316345F|nr:TauD/TfdA family dioxygenase [Variovorax sp. SRS16]VTU13995.1 Alpha-ketoglutarate-dependent taurine dioxygenase [Variovorax sp. SRS16]